jgi:phosphomannomutase
LSLSALRQDVLRAGAHFGIWCDGDGLRCYVLDERGHFVPPASLLVALVSGAAAWATKKPTAVVLEPECDARTAGQLAALGVRVHRAAAHRRTVYQAMLEHAAIAGGGPSGRLWLAAEVLDQGPHGLDASAAGGSVGWQSAAPRLDALAALTLWLHILSRSDLAASEVLRQPLRGSAIPPAGGCGSE